jgi:Domain of unknown function (DUF4276)
MNAAVVVEGDGEVAALPVLLRRLVAWRTPGEVVSVLPPIRVARDRFLSRDGELQRYTRLAAQKSGPDGWVLVLLDADDDCPAELGPSILARCRAAVADRRISVVLANREYEAWFIAAAQSLDGHRGLRIDPGEAADAETPRDAKGWIRRRMPGRSYGETTDQPAFSAAMDLQQAFDGSRSFRKLCREWERQHAAG